MSAKNAARSQLLLTSRTSHRVSISLMSGSLSRMRFRWIVGALCAALVAAACASSTDTQTTPAETASSLVPTDDASEGGDSADPEPETVEPTTTTGDPVEDPAVAEIGTQNTEPPELAERVACSTVPAEGRVDVRSDGNRLSTASIDLTTASAFDVALPSTIEWVVPSPTGGWLVTTTDQTAHQVTDAGVVIDLGSVGATPAIVDADGGIGSAFDGHDRFDDPLLDGRVVRSGSLLAVLASPTDQYAHNVLGDAIEAAAIEWVDICDGTSGRIAVPAEDVIEGIAPILADIDGDDVVEVLVTLSNSSVGARLAAYELDGPLLAESAPIGQGNRWRNQLAVGPFGPEGQTEILDVQTPHIGGILQAFQLVEGEGGATLERAAASAGAFTSHPIRTRNLDMGIALDVNDDGNIDALVSAFERDRIIGMTRTNDPGGWAPIAEVPLPGTLTSNVAVSDFDVDNPAIAAGAGTTLRIWR